MNYDHNKKVGLLKFYSGHGKFNLNSPKGYSLKIINAQTGSFSCKVFRSVHPISKNYAIIMIEKIPHRQLDKWSCCFCCAALGGECVCYTDQYVWCSVVPHFLTYVKKPGGYCFCLATHSDALPIRRRGIQIVSLY